MRDIIFMDAEYAKLTAHGVDLISIALIKQTGEELYVELDHEFECSEWVQENVLPYLTGEKVSHEEAKKRIRAFVGEGKPHMVSYVDMFDWMGICKFFAIEGAVSVSTEAPFHWLPLDLASILYAKGHEPDELEEVAEKLGIDISNIQPHYALDDARLVKKIYEKIMK